MPLTMPTLPTLPKREATAVPRSQTERLWLIGGGLVAFVLLLIGYFFFISPQRSETADVDGQVATVQQQNAQLKSRLETLQAQNKNLAKYQADLAKARLALPSTSGVPDFLRTLQALGNSTHTEVTAITVGQPAPAVAAPAAANPAPGANASASAGSGSAPAAPAPATLFSLTITANVTGSPSALNRFLDQLQTVQPRAVLITQISESATTAGSGAQAAASGGTSLQLSMLAFVAPVPTPAAAPSAPSH